MASVKAEKTVSTQSSGQVKEPAAKPSDNATKAPASKSGAKKAAPKAPPEPKKKGKGGKSSKH
ncbi:hypothetical protein I3760_06G099700 [Carya illinoinensis]|uniref:Uncharacterized protein n=1 Tax=Carya illinoinensis TaxID=32201 RepID=A0A8T1Q9U0_CARIL|nr:hypothetical protein I3760_06G099700 [Carya illinoinensis]KAG6651270.1 hypothetical protein CIPAW_06G099000 [Carya illinoinensis]KAG6708792.1 hypothetical protein I3842_06G099400 [Carya illinoinensis]